MTRPRPLDPSAPLRSMRAAAGVRQIDLAERLGVTQGAVSHAEATTDPGWQTIRRWAEALGYDVGLTVRRHSPG